MADPLLRPGPPAGGPAAAQERSGGFARDSATVAGWTLVSRLTGFARVATVAAVLGPSYLGNVYLAVNTLPTIVYYLLTGSMFTRLLAPLMIRHLDAGDRRAAARLARDFLGWVLALFGVVTAAALLFAPLVLGLLTVAVRNAPAAEAQREVGLLLLALLMPQLLLYAVAGTGEAIMNAHGRFALAAAAPALENVGIIATLAATAAIYGVGTPLAQVPRGQLLLLGLGTTAAVALHAAGQWTGAWRCGVALYPTVHRSGPEIRAIARRAVPSVGTTGLDSLRRLGLITLTNQVPGGVVAFTVAQNFTALPFAMGARPVAVALLPRLARCFHRQDSIGFRDELARGVRLASLVVVPAAVGCAALAGPAAEAVAFGSMDRPGATALIAAALGGLAAGILGESLLALATASSYAREDAHTPFVTNLAGVALTCAVAVAAALTFEGAALLAALGAAVSAGLLLAAGLLSWTVWSGLPLGMDALVPTLLRVLVASLLMAYPARLVADLLSDPGGGGVQGLIALLAAAATGAVLFAVVLLLLGGRDLLDVRRSVPR